MSKQEDCYFFIDGSVAYEERTVSALCVNCKEEKMPNEGWFWEGSKLGYGPFDFICCICGHIIHKGEKNENENKNN